MISSGDALAGRDEVGQNRDRRSQVDLELACHGPCLIGGNSQDRVQGPNGSMTSRRLFDRDHLPNTPGAKLPAPGDFRDRPLSDSLAKCRASRQPDRKCGQGGAICLDEAPVQGGRPLRDSLQRDRRGNCAEVVNDRAGMDDCIPRWRKLPL